MLNKKEIENFAVHEDAFVRLMARRTARRDLNISNAELSAIFQETVASFEAETRANIVANYLNYHRRRNPKLDEKTIFARAFQIFQELWNDATRRIGFIPGKDFISALSARCDAQYRCSLTINQLIDAMHVAELDDEVRQLADAINEALRR